MPHSWSTQRISICVQSLVKEEGTPGWVREIFASVFRRAGFNVTCDRPFAGALVPQEHYLRERRVAAIMVEINRTLYLEGGSAAPRKSFDHIARRIRLAYREASWMVMCDWSQTSLI